MEYYFDFSAEKNALLIEERGICFEHIISLINEGFVVDIIQHPNQVKYLGQKIYVVDVDGYCYLVPYIVEGNKIFLKTIIPSRKATKKIFKPNRKEL